MKTVRYYDTPFEAEVARGMLESEGIAAIVQNENMGSVLPLTGAISSMRPYVVVADEDFTRACELLGASDESAPHATTCPECGSDELEFRFSYRDRPLSRLVSIPLIIFLLFAGSCPGNIRRRYYCRKCGSWS